MSKSDSKVDFELLTLNVVKTLEKRMGICDVKLVEKAPLERHHITQWEQKYSCLMPDDVKHFYMTINGLKLTWSAKINDTRVPVGKMDVHGLERLVRIGGVSGTSSTTGGIPTLLDIVSDEDTDLSKPQFDHRSRLFELSSCDGNGKVCLVFRETKPGIPAHKAEVWFLDRSLRWHRLATDFVAFYRLQLAHLGLPQWWYAFTDIGLSPQAQQWFNLYAPLRLDVDHAVAQQLGSAPATNVLDVSRVFKSKADKKKAAAAASQAQNTAKKKTYPATNTRPTGSPGNRTQSGTLQGKLRT